MLVKVFFIARVKSFLRKAKDTLSARAMNKLKLLLKKFRKGCNWMKINISFKV